MTSFITDLPDPGGREVLIATLLEHRILRTRLCANCFSIRFRAAYAAAIRALAA